MKQDWGREDKIITTWAQDKTKTMFNMHSYKITVDNTKNSQFCFQKINPDLLCTYDESLGKKIAGSTQLMLE